MNIGERILADLREAMKAKDEQRRSTLRLLRNTIQNTEIARREPISETEVQELVAREIKQHGESLEMFQKGNRPDLADRERSAITTLTEYLPEQLARDQVIVEARKVIQEIEATGPQDKGKVMGSLMPKLRGKADGKIVNEVVSDLLT
jgi:hypothetical protein